MNMDVRQGRTEYTLPPLIPHLSIEVYGMREVYSPWCAIGGLKRAAEAVESNGWSPSNPIQARWYREVYQRNDGAVNRGFRGQELTVCFGGSSEDLHASLSKNGLASVTLGRWKAVTGGISFCSHLTVKPEWLGPTVSTNISGRPAFMLGRVCKPQFYEMEDTTAPVIVIPTKNGDRVIFWPQRVQPTATMEDRLIKVGLSLKQRLTRERLSSRFGRVIVPSIDWRCYSHLYDLRGFRTQGADDSRVSVTEGVSSYHLRIDNSEGEAEWASEDEGRQKKRETYVLSSPFIVLVERPSLNLPVLAGFYGRTNS